MMIKIPPPVRDREFKNLQELEKEWGITSHDLLEHCKNGHLKIELRWGLLREREHNKLCINKVDLIEPLIYLDTQSVLCFRSPCWKCDWYGKEENCQFVFPPMFASMDNLTENMKEERLKVSISYADLIVSKENIERFEEWANNATGQPSQDQPKKHSCEAIAAMMDAWDSIMIRKEILSNTSSKQAIIKYITKKYQEESPLKIKDYLFTDSKIEQMAVILSSCITHDQWKTVLEEDKKRLNN